MRILFTRHGESEANVERVISNRGLKHPLTLTGRGQASTLARELEERSITRIYTSPILRAVETAVIIANHLGIEYEVTPALRECDAGVLEGRGDEDAWQTLMGLYEEWMVYHRWERGFEGGESFNDVRARFVPFIGDLIQRYQDTDANLLCVGHGGTYSAMLPLVLSNVDMKFVMKNAGYGHAALVVAELGPEGLVCREWNGVSVDASGETS